MEPKVHIPATPIELKPDRPIREKIMRPHRLTNIIRRKEAIEDKHH